MSLLDYPITQTFQQHIDNGNLPPGIDFGAPNNVTLNPLVVGVVTFVGEDPNSINPNDDSPAKYIVVKSSDGSGDFYYVHLSQITAQVGQHLDPLNDIIGYSGSTGHVTGPHTHVGLRVNGVYVDFQDKLTIIKNEMEQTISDLKATVADRDQQILNHENAEKVLNDEVVTLKEQNSTLTETNSSLTTTNTQLNIQSAKDQATIADLNAQLQSNKYKHLFLNLYILQKQ